MVTTNEATLRARMAALTREAAAKVRAEKATERKAATDRLRQRASNDLAMIKQGERERARVEAMTAARAAQPITATLTKGRLTVTIDLTSPEPLIRQTAENAVKITVNRMLRWTDAQTGVAAAQALGAQGASSATAEEISVYLADEIRYAVKHGSASITVAPEPKSKRRK